MAAGLILTATVAAMINFSSHYIYGGSIMDVISIILWIGVLLLIIVTIEAYQKKSATYYRSYHKSRDTAHYDGIGWLGDSPSDSCDGGADGGDCGGD